MLFRSITAEGALDRAKMRAHVFSNPAARACLESILHPLIRAETAQRADAASSAYRILMIPLLVESGKTRDRAQRLLVVDCTEDLQLARTMARSGLAAEQVRAIMASQASRAERVAAADDVIDNNGAAGALQSQVDLLHARYRKLADAMPKA